MINRKHSLSKLVRLALLDSAQGNHTKFETLVMANNPTPEIITEISNYIALTRNTSLDWHDKVIFQILEESNPLILYYLLYNLGNKRIVLFPHDITTDYSDPARANLSSIEFWATTRNKKINPGTSDIIHAIGEFYREYCITSCLQLLSNDINELRKHPSLLKEKSLTTSQKATATLHDTLVKIALVKAQNNLRNAFDILDKNEVKIPSHYNTHFRKFCKDPTP